METRSTTVSQAFPERIQYVVPSYQRNYVWNEDDQWEPLWEDVLAQANYVLEERNNHSPHFLGTIITKHLGTGRSRLELWSVVDGQQRLTTLQVLMAGVYSAFCRYNLDESASMLRGYMLNKEDFVREDHERYKLQHKSRDYGNFAKVIRNFVEGSNEVESAHSATTIDNQLSECYSFFYAQACDYLEVQSEEPPDKRADAMTTAIMDRLEFVEIRLKDENGHSIFEALNARGEPLTEWEKTKNYILSIAVSEEDPDGDRVYTDYLSDYDEEHFWNQSISVPRFTGQRIDIFLHFFAQIEITRVRRDELGENTLRTIPRNRLYREFRSVGEQFYRKSHEELHSLLERFKTFAQIYYLIDNRDDTSFSEYARLVMYRREMLNLATLIPVFMVLVDRLGYDEKLDQALRVVDSYLMRRVVLNTQNRSFDDAVFSLVHSICDSEKGDEITVMIHEFENATWANRWPSDEEVLVHLREADMYHHISNTKKQLMWQGIARKMHEENEQYLAMAFNPAGPLTVEHVAPASWEKHWKEDLDYGETDEERDRLNKLVNLVGNLTIVTQAMNHKLFNNPWSFKRDLLIEDNLEMNRRLVADMTGDIWNADEIHNRSRVIAEYVNKIWPHADALREQLGIPMHDDEWAEFAPGMSKLDAERIIDSVMEFGVEEGWIQENGLTKTWREECYGRNFELGCGGDWIGAWLGISVDERSFILSFYSVQDMPDISINITETLETDEWLESLTRVVREAGESAIQ